MSSAAGSPAGGQRAGDGERPAGPSPPGIAAAIAEVSERASVLVREEIELAKAEVAEKVGRLARGAVVGAVAGVFFLMALFFVLVGCAWLLYYELPIGNDFTYFWGFFALAAILVVLGALAGFVAARALRSGAPPTPEMAIEEARKIRETVSASGASEPAPAKPPAPEPPPPIPVPGAGAGAARTGEAALDTDTAKGGGYGTAISG